ncbi:MAG: hypothetical protein HKM24_07105 [Gammaproteobacteria bacterium]|nr:hypothetical protein [Gammaproteobacteria bacterium]
MYFDSTSNEITVISLTMVWVLLISLGFYIGFVAIVRHRGIRSADGFLTRAPLLMLPISFIAAQFSTNVLSVFTAIADRFGYLIFIYFAIIFSALWFFYLVFKKIRPLSDSPYPALAINEALSTNKASRFYAYMMTSIVIFYAIFIGWELYIITQILSPIVFPGLPTNQAGVTIASLMLGTIAIYSTMTGLGSVVKTDLLQVGVAFALVVAIIFGNWHRLEPLSFSTMQPAADLSFNEVWRFLLLAALANYAIHPMQPFLWQIGTSAGQHAGRVLAWGLAGAFLVWTIFVIISFVFIGPAFPAMFQFEHPVMNAMVVLGIAAVFMSTSDTIVVSSIYGLHSAWHLSHKRDANDHTVADLRWVRAAIPVLLIVAFLTTWSLMKSESNFIDAILSVGGCFIVFAPIYWIYAFNKPHWVQRYSGYKVELLFAGFIAAILLQGFLTYQGLLDYGLHVVVGCLLFNFLVAALPISKSISSSSLKTA